ILKNARLQPLVDQTEQHPVTYPLPKQLTQMTMIQPVEELPDVHFHQPATTQIHGLLPQSAQRVVRRSPWPETVRTVPKVLLVNRLQRHDDRSLKDFVFQRGNPQGPGFGSRLLRNTHPTYGRRSVCTRLGTVQECREVVEQAPTVFLGRLSVHAWSTVLAGTLVRLDQPYQVQVVIERSECHRRRLLRQFRYPLLFREHGSRFRGTGHVSLQRFRNPAPPSLSRVPAGEVPRLRRYYEALRFPDPVSRCFFCIRFAIPRPAPVVRSRHSSTRKRRAWGC